MASFIVLSYCHALGWERHGDIGRGTRCISKGNHSIEAVAEGMGLDRAVETCPITD